MFSHLGSDLCVPFSLKSPSKLSPNIGAQLPIPVYLPLVLRNLGATFFPGDSPLNKRDAPRGYQLSVSPQPVFGHGIKKQLAQRGRETRQAEATRSAASTRSKPAICVPLTFFCNAYLASRSRRNERARTCEKPCFPSPRPVTRTLLPPPSPSPLYLDALYANRNDREHRRKSTGLYLLSAAGARLLSYVDNLGPSVLLSSLPRELTVRGKNLRQRIPRRWDRWKSLPTEN